MAWNTNTNEFNVISILICYFPIFFFVYFLRIVVKENRNMLLKGLDFFLNHFYFHFDEHYRHINSNSKFEFNSILIYVKITFKCASKDLFHTQYSHMNKIAFFSLIKKTNKKKKNFKMLLCQIKNNGKNPLSNWKCS